MNQVVKTLILIVVLALIGWAVWFFVPQDADAPSDDGAPADETPTISLEDIPLKGELPESDIDTSDWQTYTNEEFGFRVKYPEGWWFRDGSPEKGAFNVWFTNSPHDFLAFVEVESGSLSFASFSRSHNKDFLNSLSLGENIFRLSNNEYGDVVVLKYFHEPSESTYASYAVKYEGLVFVIWGGTVAPGADLGLAMLHSLEFLD